MAERPQNAVASYNLPPEPDPSLAELERDIRANPALADEAAKAADPLAQFQAEKVKNDQETMDAFMAHGNQQVAAAQPTNPRTIPDPGPGVPLVVRNGEIKADPFPLPGAKELTLREPAPVAEIPVKVKPLGKEKYDTTGMGVPGEGNGPPSPPPLPALKDQIAYISKQAGVTGLDAGGTAEIVQEAAKNPSFAEMLKKIGFPIMGIIQSLGYGLAGKSDQKTILDTAVEQKFAQEQQEKAAAIRQKEQEAQNEFEMKKAAVLQQYDVQNMTAQQKAELDAALAQIAAQHSARMQEIPAEVAAYMQRTRAVAGMTANPSAFWGAGGK